MPIQVDVAVLGGGPGGYTAAIRAAQEGKKVAIVEQGKLGGTCLHLGCIPSKALLRSAEVYASLLHADTYGIKLSREAVKVDFTAVQERKEGVVEQLHRGLRQLMKKHGIEVIQGRGRIIGPSIFSPKSGSLAVELEDGEMESVVSRHLIVATGSRPRQLPGLEADGETVLTSDDALRMETLPSSMLIAGGGVIGIEWASMLSDFGVRVTLVEAASRVLPGEDPDVSAAIAKALSARGVRILTGAMLQQESLSKDSGGISVAVRQGETEERLQADRLLVSVGRIANIEGIGLENTDIAVQDGWIKVKPTLQTAEPHIYAIGDVTGGVQLAHAAAHEGIAAVEHLLGLMPHPAAPHRIPRCVYSRPETASVGYTEEQARAAGHDPMTAKIPFAAIAKAIVHGDSEGFVKVVADRGTQDLLGVHMVGAHVTELIAEASLAQFLDAVPWEVGASFHPHPSLSEALGEAMLATLGKSVHF
ncbi:dihydrolipoyl dehydrogenase [Paenibacillus albicereus]|uniref:Dihydrolipoyl dehydrogenase n=1 Tax=Paenibacillus albicereus TaxID=2726185 RepID=A0A6H2GWL6_9BACL|nr:dihydrolipoyl dehydrogenase [Paenibacillus albicereus]QJC51797.1 dihydrolipoyl dehydrogenase [Paenibacillus albicereus]